MCAKKKKKKTGTKLLLLYNNTWNHLTVCKKKWPQVRLEMSLTYRVYNFYLFYTYVLRGFGIK